MRWGGVHWCDHGMTGRGFVRKYVDEFEDETNPREDFHESIAAYADCGDGCLDRDWSFDL